MTAYELYLDAVTLALDEHPEWRSGQGHFNVLAALHPEVAERVRTSALDPFYRDEHLSVFLLFVRAALGPTAAQR